MHFTNKNRVPLTASPMGLFSCTNRKVSPCWLCIKHGGGSKTGRDFSLQVSWIRRRDWSILSSGNAAFTKDARFSLLHLPGATDWTLIIKYLQQRDEGTYVCQVTVYFQKLDGN